MAKNQMVSVLQMSKIRFTLQILGSFPLGYKSTQIEYTTFNFCFLFVTLQATRLSSCYHNCLNKKNRGTKAISILLTLIHLSD